MTIEEELRTAYANLQGHQDRSLHYIRMLDEQQATIAALKETIEDLRTHQAHRATA